MGILRLSILRMYAGSKRELFDPDEGGRSANQIEYYPTWKTNENFK